MRVLHVYRTYFPDTQGGLEEVIRQICLNTRPLGVESQVFSLSADPNPAEIHREEAIVNRSKLSIEVASCGMSWSAYSNFKELSDWADLIHYHYPWPFADLLHFASKVKKPTVLTYHSDIVRQRFLNFVYRPVMKRFLSSVDLIVCTSENYFATSQVLANYAEKVEVIPIGINQNSHPEPDQSQLQECAAKYGTDFFLFVGVLRYYKGLHILLDAIQKAPFKVVIVGAGPTEQELRKQAEELNLDNVIFTGYLNDETKICLFHLCRAVVFPSYLRSEAFGVTLLEGAMCGKPLISTEVGSGTSHVNIDGETGLVVPPGSSKELRYAMDQLHHRPELANLMGQKARARYAKLFNGRLMGTRYTNIYRRQLGHSVDEPDQELSATSVGIPQSIT